MEADEAARRPRAIRASDAEWRRYTEAAAAEGLEVSPWARRQLDAGALGRTGGVASPADAAFTEALERIQRRYPVRDPAEVIRMCVLAIDRWVRGGDDPFSYPEPTDAVDVSPTPRPATPPPAAPKRSGRQR